MKCDYCPRGCEISDFIPDSPGNNSNSSDKNSISADKDSGGQGFCRTKAVRDGKIVSVNYGQVTSLALDPIEKKPLARFMPGSYILSVGSWGCNMACSWCQNDSISRGPARCYKITPEMLIKEALAQRGEGNIGIAYTYNEALTGFEYVCETAQLAKKEGLVNVLVTNGMISDKYAKQLFPLIDAMNIDLKTAYEDKYRRIGGDLQTVLSSIIIAHRTAHVEITTLIVPGFNDTDEEMVKISETIAGIDRTIPLHVTRFFPAGDMRDAEPTDVNLIYHLRDVAAERLDFVYTGNCF